MEVDMLIAVALSGAGLVFCALIGQGIRVLLYARSQQYRCDQRLRQLRR